MINTRLDRSKIAGNKRITILTIVIFLFSLIIIGRLFTLQVLQGSFYSLMASERHEVYKDLFPQRGSIYVKENDKLFPLVTNKEYYLIYAEPTKITSPNTVIDKITPILGLEEEEWKSLLAKLAKSDDPYEPIQHKITSQQVDQIEAFDLDGIGFLPESYRYYPETGIGGHIFGFMGFQNDEKVGQYGLEGYFQKNLAGESGLIKSFKGRFFGSSFASSCG